VLFARGGGFVTEMRDRIRTSLDLSMSALSGCPGVQVNPPDGGYYLFPHVVAWQGEEEELILRLLDAGVLVHPGFFYGYERGIHLMLSCLTEPTRLRGGLDVLVKALNAL
jgi:alanine-synthesizing transaminase